MTFQQNVAEARKYPTYRFGRARQIYRGSPPDLSGPYIACIGGSETFGKFVDKPYADYLDDALDMEVVNFGTPSGGPSFFLKDPVLLETLCNAELVVIQAMPAWANSNRLYSVRKRRNARMNSVSEMLRLMYPEVEMDRFRYAHNLLYKLYTADAEKFRMVELELRAAWVARMRELIDQIETRRLLFWFSERLPEEDGGFNGSPEKLISPAFVNRDMMEQLRPMVEAVVEFVPAEEERGAMLRLDDARVQRNMIASRLHPSPAMHEDAAKALEIAIRQVLKMPKPVPAD